MGFCFSNARQPRLTVEGDAHAVLRLGWDFVFEHEHGFTQQFWRNVTDDSALVCTGEHPQAPRPAGGWCRPVAFGHVVFSEYEHVMGDGPSEVLHGVWLGKGPVDPGNVNWLGGSLWAHRRPMNKSGVDVAWQSEAASIWFRADTVVQGRAQVRRASDALSRFEAALRSGKAVFGMVPRFAAPQSGTLAGSKMEPYLATSSEFAYEILDVT